MTTARSEISITSRLVQRVLFVKLIANFAKSRARAMTIDRADKGNQMNGHKAMKDPEQSRRCCRFSLLVRNSFLSLD